MGAGRRAALDDAGRARQATAAGSRLRELEPGLLELTAEPKVGIGQSAFVVSGEAGDGAVGSARVRRRRGGRADPSARRGARDQLQPPAHVRRAARVEPAAGRRARARVAGRTSKWVSRTGPADPRAWTTATSSRPGSRCIGSAATSPAARCCTGRRAPAGAACCCPRTRSTPTPTGRRSRSCAATRTGSRCRRRSSSGSPSAAEQLEFDRLYDNFARGDRHRRERRGAPLGRPLHRLGARRPRRPDLSVRTPASTVGRRPLVARPHDATTRIAASERDR